MEAEAGATESDAEPIEAHLAAISKKKPTVAGSPIAIPVAVGDVFTGAVVADGHGAKPGDQTRAGGRAARPPPGEPVRFSGR
jgi:hypothetical protein